MIIKTAEELRYYMPTHNINNIELMNGFLDSSEHEFLLEKIGKQLLKAVQAQYDTLTDDLLILSPTRLNAQTAWHKLIVLCQRAVVYDAFARSAEISAVSINEAGINVMSTGDYDAAADKQILNYKNRCKAEAHAAINRLLVQLEEWSMDVAELKEGDEPMPIETEIVELWRKSRYYYLVNGLFINTATKFNEFVDIYNSREKFIQLLPDLRYCQEIILRSELGDDLIDFLIDGLQKGTLTITQRRAVELLQRALAMHVEARNKILKRPDSKDEAILNTNLATSFIASHQGDFGEAIKTSPLYKEPLTPTPVDSSAPTPEPWKNNRKGDSVFILPSIE